MAINNRHIINKVQWSTRFNNQPDAFRLQETISTWSKHDLGAEAGRILNKFCPHNETWRIDLLELDLGRIAYEDVKGELSARFKRKLEEELRALILYPQKSGNKLEVITEQGSNLQLISFFLQHGVMPWWYKNSHGTFTQVFQYEVHQNPQHLAQLLRDVGRKIIVRKRIVFQLRDEVIRKVVEVLEPYHYHELLEFSDHVCKIQHEEKMVEASESEFKKQLWLWILHHLLEERGTLFNTVAFVKSSIYQMAMHYNLEYNHLLDFVLNALGKMRLRNAESPTFLTALTILQKESKKQKNSAALPLEITPNLWVEIQGFMKGEIKTISHIDAVISSLISSHPSRLKEVFASAKVKNKIWARLRDQTLKELIGLYLSNHQEFVFAYIAHIPVEYRKTALLESMQIALYQKSFNRSQYVQQVMQVISTTHRVSYENLAIRMAYSEFKEKKTANIDVLFVLKSLVQYTKKNVAVKQFNHAVQKAYVRDWISSGMVNDPAQLLDELGETSLKLFSEAQKKEIFKTKGLLEVVTQMVQLLTQNRHFLHGKTFEWHVYKITLQCIIHQKNVTPEKVLWEVFHKLSAEVGAHLPYFSWKGVDKKWREILQKQIIQTTPDIWRELDHFITSDNHQAVVQRCAIINQQKLFRQTQFTAALQHRLLNYLIADGHQWKASLYKKFALLSKEQMDDVFWSCLLEFKRYDGNRTTLYNQIAKGLTLKYAVAYHQHDQEIHHSKLRFVNDNQISAHTALSALEKGLIATASEVEVDGYTLSVSTLLQWCLDTIHHQTIMLLKRYANKLPTYIALEKFLVYATEMQEGRAKTAWYRIREWREIVADAGMYSNEIQTLFWDCVIRYMHGTTTAEQIMKILVPNTLDGSPSLLTILSDQVKNANVSPELQSILHHHSEHHFPMQNAPEVERKGSITDLSDIWEHHFTNGVLPVMYQNERLFTLYQLYEQTVTHDPLIIQAVLRKSTLHTVHFKRITAHVSYEVFTQAICNVNTHLKVMLRDLVRLYEVLHKVNINGVGSEQIQQWLYQKTITAWKNDYYKTLESIWQELMWELATQHNVPKEQFFKSFAEVLSFLPVSLQVSLQVMMERNTSSISPSSTPYFDTAEKLTMRVTNAGVVLAQVYFNSLFQRLELVDNHTFKSKELQRKAVHYLQFLSTAQRSAAEEHLVLNKVLCGLHPSEPVALGIDIPDEEVALIEGLLMAMINYWTAIGECSIEGFRGNWMVREGVLYETDDRWELMVEKRPYDILIDRSPFSFSIIKFPWMEKPLHVTWQY